MTDTGTASPRKITTRCCVVGGGPAGMMTGFLLARAGIDVVVLEKHRDFLRDFRGDTVHPSTLELMHELGLLDDFLKRPHSELHELTGWMGDMRVKVADFSHLPVHCRFIAIMPQWDFLNFLAEHGQRYPSFHLHMQAEATDLVISGDRVSGVRAKTPEGPLEIAAELVIAADGRHSTIRERAGFAIDDLGAPMDVLWIRLSKKPEDPAEALGRFDRGRILVMIDRNDYWQCGYVIPKGGIEEVKRAGLAALQADLVALAPFLADRVGEIENWDHVKLLTVAVDRLQQWYWPGLLCIGDSAHAMSPIGGVGINLAVQDAVAAANILAPRFAAGSVTVEDLRDVQHRRELPTRLTQRLQVTLQKRIISRVLATRERIKPPLLFRLLGFCPLLRRLPARLIGMGLRPEHIRTPDAYAQGARSSRS